jgi:DNA-binding PadR family transcriptional regulator
MRHTALVPKGFLRHNVLELLSEKPMSGSEIIDEIEKRTNGRWKPSPGSIYPLLAWLQDNVYVKEIVAEEGGMKRYALTDKGKALLEQERKIKEKLQKEAKLLPPPFLGALWFRIPPEKTVKLRESMNRVVCSFFELAGNLQENFSEQVIGEIQKVLDETAAKLEEINKKFRK